MYDSKNTLIEKGILISEAKQLTLSKKYKKKTDLEKVLELENLLRDLQQEPVYLIIDSISKEEADILCNAMLNNRKFTLITLHNSQLFYLAFERAGYNPKICFKSHFFRIYGHGYIAYILKEDQEPLKMKDKHAMPSLP